MIPVLMFLFVYGALLYHVPGWTILVTVLLIYGYRLGAKWEAKDRSGYIPRKK